MKKTLMAGAAILALGVAGQASAQIGPSSGVYVAGDIGYHMMEGIDAQSSVSPNVNWTFDAEDDLAGFLRLGYRISPNFRAELEGGYRKGDIESVRGGPAAPVGLCRAGIARTVAAPTCQSPQGEIRTTSAMFNLLYDFLPDSRFQPYVGVGVGRIEVHNKVFGQLANVPAGGLQFQNASIDDADQAFAYQGLLGFGYAVTDRLTVDVTGRYLAANDLNFGSITQNGGSTVGTITNVGFFEGDYRDASVSVGLRYQFGALAAPPAPLPPPPPQPQPPRRRSPSPLRLRRSRRASSSSTSRSISTC
jgi:opacity protein-like surface antigen